MKKLILVFMFFIFVPMLNSCSNDAGIIKWTLDKDVLDWEDVENAAYYEIIFYDDDNVTENSLFRDNHTFFAYISEYCFYSLSSTTLNLKIKVFYIDGTTDESSIINFTIEQDFPYPHKVIFGDYVGYRLSWTNMSSEDLNFINYTVKINDDVFDTELTELNMNDYDAGVYKIQVKANYEDGSSIWTIPIYENINETGEVLEDSYDSSSGEDYSYTLNNGDDIIAVQGRYIFLNYRWVLLPDYIVSIDGSTFTIINQYYFELEGNIDPNTSSIIMSFLIVTDTNIYTLNIMNQ